MTDMLAPTATALVVTPDDPAYDEARLAWNLAVDQRPAGVVLPESVDDVVAAVEYARERGLRVAAQGTGHNAGPLGSLEDTLLVRTSRMRGVRIDPVARRARVAAGALWADVVAPAAEHGLAPLAGSSHDVGVVGYSLGGGLSWLARRYGLAANSVLAVEIVTADGDVVRADAENEPDLFWALRGGGGSFGVVTALEFALYPVEEVFAGALFFPIERAAEVLAAWREWVDRVPDEVTSVGRMLRFPPLPDIPEPLRGNAFAVVEAAMLLDADEGDDLLRHLRALGPQMDTFATIPASGLLQLHMDPPEPVPGSGDHTVLADVTSETLDALMGAAGPDVDSPLLSVELRHLGGAVGRPAPGQGALGTIDGRFILFGVGIAATPEMKAGVDAHLERLTGALARWDSGREYLNFAERPTDSRRLFGDASHRRLRAVKAGYDPEDLFRSNHPTAAAR